MTSRLTFQPGSHAYRLADPVTRKSRPVPSVSGLKNLLYPFANERWTVTTALEGVTDRWDDFAAEPPTNRVDRMVEAALRNLHWAAEFGTAVHHYAEQLWTGEPVEVPDDYAAHVQFIAEWWQSEGIALVAAERMCWADADELGAGPMAGRFDLIVKHPTRGIGLLDLKTWTYRSKGAARPREWAFQLAAYASMEWMVDPDTNEDVPFPPIDWCGILHVGPGGAVLYVLPDEDRHTALAQIDYARALKALPAASMVEVR